MSVPVGSASPPVFQPLTPAHSHPLFSRLFPISSLSSFSLIIIIPLSLISYLSPRLLLRTSTVFAFRRLYPAPPTVPQIFQTTFAQNALALQNPCRKPLTPERFVHVARFVRISLIRSAMCRNFVCA